MQIRLGTRRDEEQVRALLLGVREEADWSDSFDALKAPLTDMEQAYIGKDGTFLVAEHEKEIVAVVAARRQSETFCEISLLAVSPQWRRAGLGKQLVDKVANIAEQLDYEALLVDAGSVNSEAAGFLLSRGFIRIEDGDKPVFRYSFKVSAQ